MPELTKSAFRTPWGSSGKSKGNGSWAEHIRIRRNLMDIDTLVKQITQEVYTKMEGANAVAPVQAAPLGTYSSQSLGGYVDHTELRAAAVVELETVRQYCDEARIYPCDKSKLYTVAEFAKKLDLAYLSPDLQEKDIRDACSIAKKYKLANVNVNSCWGQLIADELAGSGVGPSAVIGFPYGTPLSKCKYLELEEMVKIGCKACDMVINIGAFKDKNYGLVEEEIREFVRICGPGCDTKLIFEVGFLTDDEIATLTKMACGLGIDYVKTATGSQAFPDLKQVRIMRDNLSGDTKIKVSGVPRTFTLPAVLYMYSVLGVSLVGTRSAGELVEAYSQYLNEN
jgi:deoxyribose-phosphate aldolase